MRNTAPRATRQALMPSGDAWGHCRALCIPRSLFADRLRDPTVAFAWRPALGLATCSGGADNARRRHLQETDRSGEWGKWGRPRTAPTSFLAAALRGFTWADLRHFMHPALEVLRGWLHSDIVVPNGRR
jgi:hypothetical protein